MDQRYDTNGSEFERKRFRGLANFDSLAKLIDSDFTIEVNFPLDV